MMPVLIIDRAEGTIRRYAQPTVFAHAKKMVRTHKWEITGPDWADELEFMRINPPVILNTPPSPRVA